ncbi:MAG: ATP-binding protein, partial [Spirochaetales bacterium]|nr:ATP-binding protein [Spirochaetales bacterium]
DTVKDLLKGAEVAGFVNRYRCADGSFRWIEWRSTARGDRIFAAARDITDRRLWEQRLLESLKEKEILLKEIHHRVKNNLQIISSMLNLEMDKTTDQLVRDILIRNQNRITTIAMVHEMLYASDSMTKVDFAGHVRDLLSLYPMTKDGKTITYNLEISSASLPLDIAMPCGLMVNEIVTNSLQHALNGVENPGIRILFSVDQGTGKGRLEVSDNGPGFPSSDNLETNHGLGFQLIRALTEQIEGTLDITGEGGACFRISFNLS